MIARVRISGGMLACLLFPFSHTAAVLFMPAPVAQHAGADAPLSVLLAGLAGIAVVLVATWIARRHPGQLAIGICRRALGRWLGSAVGLIYMAFFAWLYSLVMRDLLDFVAIVLLPGTPGRVIAVIFGLVTLYGVWAGLEPVARISYQVMLFIVAALVVIPVLVFREFSLLQYSPLLTQGLGPVLKGAWPMTSWFMEAVVLLTLVPHMNQKRNPYRWALIGVGGGVVALAYLTLITVLVFGHTLTGRFMFPVYSLVQMISLAHFVERIEMVLILVWISGMFTKSTLCLYTCAEAAQQLLGLKTHRWPALVLAAVGVVLTQIWSRTLDLLRWGMSDAHSWIHGGIVLVILVLLAAGTLVRSLLRGKEQGHAQA